MYRLRKWLLKLMMMRFRVPRDVLRFAWVRYAERDAMIFPSGRLTYRQLHQRVSRLTALFATHGLQRGDIVYVRLSGCGDLVLSLLASFETGVVLAGVPRHVATALLWNASQLVPPKAILFDAACQAEAGVLLSLTPGLAAIRIDEVPKVPPPFTSISPKDIAVVGFTSGTTAAPKAMVASHGAYMASLRMLVSNVEGVDCQVRDVNLVGIPMMGAGSGMVLPTILSGGVLAIPPDYSIATLVAMIQRYRATRIFMTPSLLIDLLDFPDFEIADLTSLRSIVYGTEWLPVSKLQEAIRRLGPILQQGYGCAEVLPPVAMLRAKDHLWQGVPAPSSVLSSVGRVVRGVRVVVVDDQDRRLKKGGIGNILIKSPTQFMGYVDQDALNARVLRGGWFHVGDVGYFDDRGYLHVLGRKQDVISRRGHVTYPRMVEEVLHDHPAVKETAMVQLGESAVMAVSLRQSWRDRMGDPALMQQMMSLLRDRVPTTDLPDSIHMMDELPRSPLAKVVRRQVRQVIEESV